MRRSSIRSRNALGGVLVLALSLACAAGWSGPARSDTTNLKGIDGSMPAYYDGKLFTINFKEFPTGSEATLTNQNGSINFIYQSDPGLPGGAPFVSVIDAITGAGPGFNPLWLEVQIAFTAGHTPRQLFSDDEIKAAAASGEITLAPTTELYRCSVIGAAPRITGSTPTSVAAPVLLVGASPSVAATWGMVKAMYAR